MQASTARLRPTLRWASLTLAASCFLLIAACGRDRSGTVREGVPIALSIRFSEARDGVPASQSGGERSTSALPADAAAIEQLVLSAYDVSGPRTLRKRQEITIAAGQTSFRAELSVPPSLAYEITVEANGVWGEGENATERGLLFFGQTTLTDVTSGSSPSAEVIVSRVVPTITIDRNAGLSYTVRWNAVNGAGSYRLREQVSDAPPTELVTTDIAVPIEIQGRVLDPQAEAISYRVRAELADGRVSAFSESVVVVLPGNIAPAAVTDLAVASVNSDSLTLEWTAPGDDGNAGQARTYDLRSSFQEITAANFDAATPVLGVPSPGPAGRRDRVVLRGLLVETTYYFALRTADEVPNWSPLSNVVVVETPPAVDVIAPAAVSDLAASSPSPTSARLIWTAPGDDGSDGLAAEYDLRYSTVLIDVSNFLAATRAIKLGAPSPAGSNQQFIIEGLAPQTGYFFALRTRDEAGNWSDLSNVPSVTTGAATPAVPSNLLATAVSDSSVTVEWTDNAVDETSYVVERVRPEDPGQVVRFVIDSPFEGHGSFIDRQLLDRTDYRYRVRAANDAGESEPSNEVTVHTGVPRPRSVVATALSTAVIRLTWSFATPDPESFAIERRQGSGDWVLINTVSGALRLFDDEGLQPSTIYTYRLRANADGLTSLFSSEATARTFDEVAVCEVTPSALDFGIVEVGSDSTATIVIQNIGTGTLLGLPSLDVSCIDFAIVEGGSSFALGPDDTVQISVRFAPTGSNVRSCVLDLGTSCSPLPLSGIGADSPVCQVDPLSIDFGPQAVGSATERTITITNPGTGTLQGTVEQLSCAEFTITSGLGVYNLATNETRQVVVSYQPSDVGLDTCVFASGCGLFVDLSGEGTLAPVCQLSTSGIDFGTVELNQQLTRSFTITNVGGGSLAGEIVDPSCVGFDISSGTGVYALGPNESREIVVLFTPTETVDYDCTLDAGTACGTVQLHGVGSAAPLCQISNVNLDFGSVEVGHELTRSFNLSNIGGGSLSGTVLQPFCPEFVVVGGPVEYTLGPNQSVEITVRFTPTAPAPYDCVLSTGSECSDVSIHGSGFENPICALDPTELDFPDTPVGDFVERSFTITNVGSGTLTGLPSITGCPDYVLPEGTGSFALTSNQSVQVTVRFAPQDPGPQTCYLDLGTICDDLILQGAGLLAPLCELSTNSIAFGPVDAGEAPTRSFSITNAGGGTLTGSVSLDPCPTYSLDSGGGFYSLTAGQSRTVVVRYSPDAFQDDECVVRTGCASDVILSGTGIDPDSHWLNTFNSNPLDEYVATLLVNSPALYLGGDFTGSGLNHVASWQGGSWNPMSTGLSARVWQLTPWNGLIVAGGDFFEFSYVAATDGGGWAMLGGGTNNTVTTATVFNNELVIGGVFDFADSLPCLRVAKLSSPGGTFQPMGDGVGNSPTCLQVYNSQLFIGGYFGNESAPLQGIGRWNGADWVGVGSGVGVSGEWVNAMTVWQGKLIIGGAFSQAGGVGCNNIVAYNGSSFETLGSGIGGDDVRALAVYHGDLIAAGTFSSAGGVQCNNIARWDGTSWHALGSGVYGGSFSSASSLAVDGDNLYVGGSFTAAGNHSSPWIAVYNKP